MTYDEGLEIIGQISALDGPNVNPVCATRLLTHGERAAHALVLLHGFTNCPAQFSALGDYFFERGYNVVIPRYPRHGYTDRLTREIATLRADHLIAVARRTTLAAQGLGTRVTVAGLSLGGALSGWLAQNQGGLSRAILIAPAFGLRGVPGGFHPMLASAMSTLPNFYFWWDPKAKAALPPQHGYPRFSTRAYAALFHIAHEVIHSARREAPRCRSIAVVTNDNEPGLNNAFTNRLAGEWRAHGAAVTTHVFEASLGLPHDLVDPDNPDQNTELVYPVLERLIAQDEEL